MSDLKERRFESITHVNMQMNAVRAEVERRLLWEHHRTVAPVKFYRHSIPPHPTASHSIFLLKSLARVQPIRRFKWLFKKSHNIPQHPTASSNQKESQRILRLTSTSIPIFGCWWKYGAVVKTKKKKTSSHGGRTHKEERIQNKREKIIEKKQK